MSLTWADSTRRFTFFTPRMKLATTPVTHSRMGLDALGTVWSHRRRLRALALHSLRRTYAGTFGGVVWAIATPLLPILLFSVIFSFGLRLPLGDAPYIFGFASAYVPWVLLSSSLSDASGSLLKYRYLVKRVRFPVALLPVHTIVVHSFAHAVLALLVGVACGLGGYGRVPDVLTIIYFYGCAVLLSVGLSLLISAVAVVAMDVQQLVPSLLHVWFWVTPIAWSSVSLPPMGQTLLAFNPASYVVSGYRFALMPTVFAAPTLFETTAFWTVSLGVFLLGSLAFGRLRAYFWERL